MNDLSSYSNERLVDAFADISRQQGTALENEDTRRYNLLFAKLRDIADELRSRGAEAQKALIPLLEQGKEPAWSYQVAQTRFNAAEELDTVVPALAQTTLQSLASRGPRKYRGMAGMAMSLREQGIYKPT